MHLKKYIAVFLAFCLLISSQFTLGTLAADYKPGPVNYELELQNSLSLDNSTLTGDALSINAGGSAVYDFLARENMVLAKINYNLSESALLTIYADGIVHEVELSETETEKEFPVTIGRGSHNIKISSNKNITINKITFTKQKALTSEHNSAVVKYSPYEEAVQSAVIVSPTSVAIKVDGAMRYIDYDDHRLTPLCINGMMYLPVDTIARAFSLYYEDYPELNYVYLSNEKIEIYWGDKAKYAMIDGNKTEISDFVLSHEGRRWIPLRQLANTLGLTVEFKDGFAIADDRICVKNIANDSSIISAVREEFAPFDVSEIKGGNTYHVSKEPYASDTNSGSENFPFATIQRAADIAKAGDTVIIHEGIYRETVTPKNNGTAANPIVFRAAEGENVIISAFEEHSGFVIYDEEKGIYQTPINSIGYDRNFIIWNDEILREGVHPNTHTSTVAKDYAPYTSALEHIVGDIRIINKSEKEPYTAESEIDLNQEQKDYWKGGTYLGIYSSSWTLNYAEIVGSEKGKIYIEGNKEGYGYNYYSKGPFPRDWGYITNHYNTIDMPGEWYVDDTSKTLFMMLPEGANPDTFTIELKQRQKVFDLTGKKFIKLHGINTRGGGITMAGDSEMCVVEGGEHKYISHVGRSASHKLHDLRFYDKEAGQPDAPEFGEVGFFAHGVNNAFINNHIMYSAGAGIHLTGKYAFIENNFIEHTGVCGPYPSGITVEARKGEDALKPRGGHTIVSNSVWGAGRGAMYLSVGKVNVGDKPQGPIIACDIGYNDFRWGSTTARDSGVLYTYGITAGNDWMKTSVHHNILREDATEYHWDSSSLSTLMYHDGLSSNFEDHSNIYWYCDENFVERVDGNAKSPSASVFYQTEGGQEASVAGWACNDKKLYNGEKSQLTAADYPYSKPYLAGSTLEYTERFMLNYNMEGLAERKLVKDSIPQGNAYIGDNGYGVIVDETGSFTFKDVKLFEKGTKLDIYYVYDMLGNDTTSTDYARLKATFTKDGKDLNYGYATLTDMGYYPGTVMRETMTFEGTDLESADVKISVLNPKARLQIVSVTTCENEYDYPNEERYVEFPPDADIVYMGTFDEQLGGTDVRVGSNLHLHNSVHFEQFSSIHNTGKASLVYKDREFSQDITSITHKYGGNVKWSHSYLEIRIDDPNSEPVGVFDLFKPYENGKDVGRKWATHILDIELDTPIPAGKHDIYVRYVNHDGHTTDQATDSYYLAFHGKGELSK